MENSSMDGQGHGVSIAIPLVSKGSKAACKAAIKRAREAAKAAEAQLACLDIAEFFAAHPEVAGARFDGEWNSDDEGGSRYWCRAILHRSKASIAELGDEWDEEEDEEIFEDMAEGLVSILKTWAPQFEGVELAREEAFASVGRKLLGSAGFGEWVAKMERQEIDAAASEGRGSAPAPRI